MVDIYPFTKALHRIHGVPRRLLLSSEREYLLSRSEHARRRFWHDGECHELDFDFVYDLSRVRHMASPFKLVWAETNY